jgi:hypothetical protein
MGQPFHQTFLVDVFDATTAFAGKEQRLVGGALSTTYSAGISFVFVGRSVVGRLGHVVVRGGLVE